jgi:hypothetical protein
VVPGDAHQLSPPASDEAPAQRHAVVVNTSRYAIVDAHAAVDGAQKQRSRLGSKSATGASLGKVAGQ